MKLRTLALFFASFALLLAGCSDDDGGPTTDSTPVADSGPELDGAGADLTESDGPAADGQLPDQAASDLSQEPGVATDVVLGLHDNKVKIKLSTMEVLGEQETDWDLYMEHGDPVDQLPHLVLGEGVTAQNLGNETDFHDVNSAPADGYAADDPVNQTFVIGSSWRDGGSGTGGFHMTENVYAIKCADGNYAKIEVLSAKSGEIHVLSYYQADGSTNLQTAAQ